MTATASTTAIESKSIGYAYPASPRAREYWSARGMASEAERSGVWYVVIHSTEAADRIAFSSGSHDEANSEALRLPYAWCPRFVASTLNRIGAR